MRRLRLQPLLILALAAALAAPLATAQEDEEALEVAGTERHPLEPPDTSSPRATFRSFLVDANAAWSTYLSGVEEGEEEQGRAARYVQRAARCLDLSEVPPAQRDEIGTVTMVLLLDVFNRIPLPAPANAPDDEQMEREGLTRWVIPHTSITIARVEEGPRAGEWLFTPETVAGAREFYRRTRGLALKPGAVVEDGFGIYVALAGWLIPIEWINTLPTWTHALYWDQTVWQWGLLVLALLLAGLLAWMAFRVSRRAPTGERPGARRALIAPLALLVIARVTDYLVAVQIHVTGTIFKVLQIALDSIFFLAAAWAVVLVGSLVAQAIVTSPRVHTESVNAHLIRVGARIASIALAIFVVVEGARSLGIPVVGVVAGLGVGGLAIALAAQPTIENFIGGLTLFADRPVQIGDFCRFGDQLGTVEEIGLRSTRIRTLDRSVLTVPNSDFARLQLDNLTLRDRILLRTKLSLRLETTTEQLERVRRAVRELLLGHDDVDDDPARVRLVALGPHSLDLEIFAYVKTDDWSTFLAIQEGLFVQILREVEAAGTALAPPAHTAYLRPEEEAPGDARPA